VGWSIRVNYFSTRSIPEGFEPKKQCAREALSGIFQKHIERLTISLTLIPEDKRAEILKEIDENMEKILKKCFKTVQS
jgi:hypothetical protein